jgi:alcohol dehydrogenase class IV
MPQPLTAATGMDALTHAIECYSNAVYHPMSKALAMEAIRLCGSALRRAYANGRDLDARTDMLLASTMAAMAFTRTRLGNVHAMSHPVGAHFNVPHGVANALLLPYVMDWNLPGCLETYPLIARYSKGIPRLINTLCDNALLEGFLRKHEQIEADLIHELARDLNLSS